MGNSFLTYSARDNNCQNFVLSLLQANGLSNERNILFTKQSTTALFSTEMRKLTNTISDYIYFSSNISDCICEFSHFC